MNFCSAPRGVVCLGNSLNKVKSVAQLSAEAGGVIPDYIQAATPGRTIQGECGDDEAPARACSRNLRATGT